MRKIHKAAVVVAMLSSVGFMGAGTASAHEGPDVDVTQANACRSHDLNVDVLGEVGLLNGVLGNALGGEGNPGAQATHQGSSVSCSNDAF
ncbi:hypothetical protein QFZ63_003471 [Streptomyces sp. B3I7]|uniref:hypothetical protein n=1 Tax=unclassified Streptomyces TaxID=2593676 RepID=UPI0027800D3B|nr:MULTISPECIES: hypothetical protein [unclassified Streptomyces]MDQ0788637.1 hypothetical protein [Streptomyces sp. B3I8]MDQ0811757.1 hypothetical protein [Streptomyces sp. B3I7]